MVNPFVVEQAVKQALIEDNHYIDVTSDLLLPQNTMAKGYIVAKESGIICGIDVAEKAFRLCDPNCELIWSVKDGDSVERGQTILNLTGNARSVLKAERVALNFMQRMSGVATLTHSFSKHLVGTSVKLVDTRKTTPLFRPFEKYSVMMGGGANHRYNLSDCVMLKDNHIAIFGSIQKAIQTAKQKVGHTIKIEVEVETIAQCKEALESEADIIMLDNMTTEMMSACVALRNQYQFENGHRAILEASGNIVAERLVEIARIGVDVISSGALTHSYKALDVSLKLSFF